MFFALFAVGIVNYQPSNDGKANHLLSAQETRRFEAMATDERDILELLKDELDFVEKGGYGRSVRTPWQSKSTFQDSLSCINYGYPYRAHPCNECHLLDFVSPENRTQEVPCHHIPLNTDGETIEELELRDNQAKLGREVSKWLRTRIKVIEEERAEQAGNCLKEVKTWTPQ